MHEEARGVHIVYGLFGPLMTAAAVIAALVSPLRGKPGVVENGYLAAVLLTGLASMSAYAVFRRPRTWQRLAGLLAAFLLGALAWRFLLTAGDPGGGAIWFTLQFALLTLLCAAFFLGFYRWLDSHRHVVPLLAVPAALAVILLAGGVLLVTRHYFGDTFDIHENGHQVSLSFKIPVSAGDSCCAAGDGVYLFGPEGVSLLTATGEERWRRLPGDFPFPAGELAAGGIFEQGLLIFNRTAAGTGRPEIDLCYLDPATGEMAATPPALEAADLPQEQRLEAGEVLFDGERFYLTVKYSETAGMLTALNRDGAQAWQRVSAAPFDRPVVTEGLLLFGMEAETWCLDADTGFFKWSFAGGTGVNRYAALSEHAYLYGYELFCLDRETGDILWTWEPARSGNGRSAPIVSLLAGEERLLAALSDGRMAALDPAVGKPLWECDLEEEIHSLFAQNGYCIAGTALGGVFCVGPDGKIAWRFRAEGYEPVREVCQTGHTFCFLTGDRLYGLDWRN